MGEKASIARHEDARDEVFVGNEDNDAGVIEVVDPLDHLPGFVTDRV